MCEERIPHEVSEEIGGTISADAFRRICLLNIIDDFRLGAYGLKRLHKVAYIAERDLQQMKPFEFKRYIHGQYSETLDVVKDQLISLGYIAAIPLDTTETVHFKLPDGKVVDLTTGGNRYVITDGTLMDFYQDALARVSRVLLDAIRKAIHEYGYLREDELLRRCYDFPEFVRTGFEDIIFDSDLPDQIEIAGLSQDDCDELELSLNPKFIPAMAKIIKATEQSSINVDRIATIEPPL